MKTNWLRVQFCVITVQICDITFWREKTPHGEKQIWRLRLGELEEKLTKLVN